MRNATKIPNNVKNSPPKEKMFPSSPMDDIERGKVHWCESFGKFALNWQLLFKSQGFLFVILFGDFVGCGWGGAGVFIFYFFEIHTRT